jgi:hypothetical protein
VSAYPRDTHTRTFGDEPRSRRCSGGLGIQAARNAAQHDLTKKIGPASLADLLGYSPKIMNIHSARAAVPMATYPAINRPQHH